MKYRNNDSVYFYHFWLRQYGLRKSIPERFFDCRASVMVINDISDETEIYPGWDVKELNVYNVLDNCSVINMEDDFVTLKIRRDIPIKMLVPAFMLYKHCYTPHVDDDPSKIFSIRIPVDESDKPAIESTEPYLAILELAKQSISTSDARFRPSQWGARAIGAWLWDYVQGHGGEKKRGVIAAAIRAIKDQLGLKIKALGFATSEERVFRGFHRRTAECIEACEVLSFK